MGCGTVDGGTAWSMVGWLVGFSISCVVVQLHVCVNIVFYINRVVSITSSVSITFSQSNFGGLI